MSHCIPRVKNKAWNSLFVWGISQKNLKDRLSASWPGPLLPKVTGYFICFVGFGFPGWSSLSCELQASLKAYTLSFLWPHSLFGLKNILHVYHWYLKVALPVVFWPFILKLLYFLEPGSVLMLKLLYFSLLPWMTFIDKHKIIFKPSLLLLYCWNNLVHLRLDWTVFVKNLRHIASVSYCESRSLLRFLWTSLGKLGYFEFSGFNLYSLFSLHLFQISN